MAALQSIVSLTLDLPPSCIQFCPKDPELFVVGTYHLHRKDDQPCEEQFETVKDGASAEEAPQKRTGSLILFRLGEHDTITQLSTLPTDSAILDLQWNKTGDTLAVATSTGQLLLFRLNAEQLSSFHAAQITSPETLVLSLTWHPTDASVIGVTLSDGRVCIVKGKTAWQEIDQHPISVEESFTVTELPSSHSLEAWTLAFNPYEDSFSPNDDSVPILSGGDDILLQCHKGTSDLAAPALLWQDRKLHSAGITAILPLTSSLILTGSYDDHIRLLSVPPTGVGRKKCLAEMNLGGGVWRLKVIHEEISAALSSSSNTTSPKHATSKYTILASCMHAGTRIIRLSRSEQHHDTADPEESDWSFDIVARFEEHQSMNYGSDVQPSRSSNSSDATSKTVVSTSFYDKLLCVWRVLV